MRTTRTAIRTTRLVLAIGLVLAASALGVIAAAGAQDSSSSGEKSILRVGWAQDPGTLNPFVGLDEEDFSIWSINWDLLVNFDPKTLEPGPGDRQELGHLRGQKTVTYHLFPDAEVVRRQAASPRRTSSSRSRCSATTAPCSPATRAT